MSIKVDNNCNNFSIFDSTYTSDDNEINTGVSRSTCSESIIKHFRKEKNLAVGQHAIWKDGGKYESKNISYEKKYT